MAFEKISKFPTIGMDEYLFQKKICLINFVFFMGSFNPRRIIWIYEIRRGEFILPSNNHNINQLSSKRRLIFSHFLQEERINEVLLMDLNRW